MLMTIFTDASVCAETGAAGWGAWAKGDNAPASVFMGGAFRQLGYSSNEAELAAITNAIWRLIKDGRMDGIDSVMVQADNQRALVSILKMIPRSLMRPHGEEKPMSIPSSAYVPSPHEKMILSALRELVDDRQLTIYVRHVKGHQGQGKSRKWVNTQCDKLARKHMRLKRADLKGEPAQIDINCTRTGS